MNSSCTGGREKWEGARHGETKATVDPSPVVCSVPPEQTSVFTRWKRGLRRGSVTPGRRGTLRCSSAATSTHAAALKRCFPGLKSPILIVGNS